MLFVVIEFIPLNLQRKKSAKGPRRQRVGNLSSAYAFCDDDFPNNCIHFQFFHVNTPWLLRSTLDGQLKKFISPTYFPSVKRENPPYKIGFSSRCCKSFAKISNLRAIQ